MKEGFRVWGLGFKGFRDLGFRVCSRIPQAFYLRLSVYGGSNGIYYSTVEYILGLYSSRKYGNILYRDDLGIIP